MLLITALIWGTAFVAQSVGMDYIGPFTFGAVRFMIGGLVLLPFIFIRQKLSATPEPDISAHKGKMPSLLLGGACCGGALMVANSFQQFGLLYTTVSKGGFITALYIILVPVLGLLFGRRIARRILISIVLAVIGLYLLCMTDSFSDLNPGDILMAICALGFAVQIMAVDHFVAYMDGVKLSCAQFFFASFYSWIAVFLTENPCLSDILAGWLPIVYAGAFSCGIAYTLQVVAQKNLAPTIASLIMSLESVFSVLAGWIILDQTLTSREILGCMLMFAAVVLANLQGSSSTSE